jgi:hypothetical protein
MRSLLRRFGQASLHRRTILLGLASAIVLGVPALTVIAMISIIGLPLAIAMMLTPTVFLVCLGASCGTLVAPQAHPRSAWAGAGLSLVLLAGLAAHANSRLEASVADFLGGDHDELTRPLDARTLAIVHTETPRWPRGKTRCDALCQRLLVGGTVKRVLVLELERGSSEWTGATRARSYRLERRSKCPPIDLAEGYGRSRIDARTPPETQMRLAVAAGRCLIEEEATLADADVVVTGGRIHRGHNQLGAGLSVYADTVRAYRVAVAVRKAGEFVETYRWTGADVDLHPPILVPSLVGGAELRMKAGFLRRSSHRNPREFWVQSPDLGLFLRDEAGFAITARQQAAAPDRAAILEAALDRQGPLSSAEQSIVRDLFEELRDSGNERLRAIALRALADSRVVAPRNTWALVRATAGAGEAANAELADVLLRRLAETDPDQREDDASYLGYPVDYLADAIAQLPESAVRAHRDDLERLAHDPERRARGYTALYQLAAFADEATPTMLFLLDEAWKIRSADRPRGASQDDWQHPYLGGLIALCRSAPRTPGIVEPLATRLREGRLLTNGSYGELLLTTLIQAGADPAELRPLLVKDETPEARERFDLSVERARSRPRCSF